MHFDVHTQDLKNLHNQDLKTKKSKLNLFVFTEGEISRHPIMNGVVISSDRRLAGGDQ